jgi:alpha-ketoglutarate-dependent taurine dioxygenase
MQCRGQFVSAIPESLEVDIGDEQHRLPLLIRRKAKTCAPGSEAFLCLWQEHRQWLDTELYKHGALLFRGFDISDVSVFEFVIAQFKEQSLHYAGGNSPRTRLGKNVYTSTEYPPEYFISLHNELSYSNQWPARLLFCCVEEPEEGGQTPLVDSRLLLKALPKHLVEEFQTRGVKYIRNLHSGKGFGLSWQKTFESSDRADVEAYARSLDMDVKWHQDGSLSLCNIRPATAIQKATGHEVWFNQADQFHPSTHPPEIYNSLMALYKGREDQMPQNATFGDGTSIPREYLEIIRNVTRHHLALFDWRRGDLLLVDNMLVAHGRMPFKGRRRILVSMIAG